jgi:hypothetical protein
MMRIIDPIEAMHDIATLESWLVLVGTREGGEIDPALQAKTRAP